MVGCETCKFPSLTKQAANASLSIFNVITQAIKTGKARAEQDVVKKRINLCETCDQLKDNRCLSCGCYIALKAGLRAEKCPLEKW